jgi:hypothetical protein
VNIGLQGGVVGGIKKLLCTLCIILMVGCTSTGQAYLPHTSRVFHSKKSCVGCYDPNPIVFQTVQAAANSGGIAPCSMCVNPKHLSPSNQGNPLTNYAKTGGSTGGGSSQNPPLAKSKSSGVLALILILLGVAAISATTGVVPTLPPSSPSVGAKSYSYSVSGYDSNFNYVWGNVDVDQSGGDGNIYDSNGNMVYINVYWTGNGQLDGYDSNGNYYDLDVN